MVFELVARRVVLRVISLVDCLGKWGSLLVDRWEPKEHKTVGRLAMTKVASMDS